MNGLPPIIRQEITERLWKLADDIHWLNLPQASKSRYYDNWTADPEIGGRLGRFLELKRIRHYIKDGVFKRYSRARGEDAGPILRRLGVARDHQLVQKYIKPHGCQLRDGRVICWGRADNWKAILLTLHERCFDNTALSPHAVVLTRAAAHFGDEPTRRVVEDAARKLGIRLVSWVSD
jgi:hypothetical protein